MSGGYPTVIRPSRPLCGLSEAEFFEVFTRLAPLVEAQRDKRLERADRKRAPGAGAKAKPFQYRLLIALTHLRQGSSGLRATAAIFGVDEKSVRNYRDEVQGLLLAHGIVVPGRDTPVRDLKDLGEYLAVRATSDPESFSILDGTETRRPRPVEWDEQKPAYSAKTHQHAVKATVLSDENGQPLWFEANPKGEGRTHDIAMLRAGDLLATLALAGIAVLGDLGYMGLGKDLPDQDVWVPVRRRRGQKHLDRDAKLYNHALAQARIRVEHLIGHLKNWDALCRWRRGPEHFGDTGRALMVLLSIRRAVTPPTVWRT